jgi:hypothetical protein
MRNRDDYWTILQTKPEHMQGGGIGRFNPLTGEWDTEAGEKADVGKPRIHEVIIPAGADYPGEKIILTPSWQRKVEATLAAQGRMPDYRAFERSDGREAVAFVRNGEVVWGAYHAGVRLCALVLSDLT